jgi:2-polyprenyl-6-methoxyphenol hydroxylase-like FAD-dependent oxidoreductase
MKELLGDLKDWPKVVKDAVRNSGDITYLKVCDRNVLEPEQWYSAKGRCVLLGDAAHPHASQWAKRQPSFVRLTILPRFTLLLKHPRAK